jgi:hypothetical protein
MKTKIFAVIVMFTLSITIFNACSERNNDIEATRSNAASTNDNYSLQAENIHEHEIPSRIMNAPLWFDTTDNNDYFKSSLIKHISASRALDSNEQDLKNYTNSFEELLSLDKVSQDTCLVQTARTAYTARNISDISAFYCFKEVEIEDFNLVQVGVLKDSILYVFARGEVLCNDTDSIIVSVCRNEQSVNSFNDDMMYNNDEITTRIGEAVVNIKAYGSFGGYEYLRDLAYQVIDSAELVDVQYELDVLRQQSE